MMPDEDDAANFDPSVLGFGDLPLECILGAHPELPEAMSPLDPLASAATFSGLLTIPELQGNTCRLEALVHCALAFGKGQRKPSKSTIAFWFREMSRGPCGRFEDPPEDVFTSVITSSRGNFRILEGMWESAAFYLQRVVNIVESMPQIEPFVSIRESVFALLAVSDLVCQRAGLERYSFGLDRGSPALPSDVRDRIPSYRQRISISRSDLESAGVSMDALSHFLFVPRMRAQLTTASLLHSPLIAHPLVYVKSEIKVLLPTAVSSAIRTFVIQILSFAGLKTKFLQALEEEYRECFREFPPIGVSRNLPIEFRDTEHGVLASCAQEVDSGRILHLVFTMDTLKGFEETGFADPNTDAVLLSDEISRDIAECRQAASERLSSREGLTLIIGCGIGRAEAYALEQDESGWRVAYLSAPDAVALSGLSGMSALTILRILDAKERLEREGVKLLNVNGLLNLLSWVQQLDGHLIPHARLTEMPEEGHLVLMIDPSEILPLRKDVISQVDLHCVQDPGGRWVRVRKADRSYFDEDGSNSLYAPSQRGSTAGLPMVQVTTCRQWWCTVEYPVVYDRWKMLSSWLPRVATVLETEVPELPKGSLQLIVRFSGYPADLAAGSNETTEYILSATDVRIDTERRRVLIKTDEAFERGLTNSRNVSERALVHAIVIGFLRLSEAESADRASMLTQQIVCDDHARDAHAFQATSFRDFVREAIRDRVVMVDKIDEATLRLGLGWRIRRRDEDDRIEGKSSCTAYLNKLVQLLEQDFCNQLKQFDRKALVTLALENYEATVVDRRRWQHSTPAMLALHGDTPQTRAVIADHDSMNNATQLASRLLVEAAVCECPCQGGLSPGEIDLSQLMARLLLMFNYGGWSDAIHYDAMVPAVRVTALGDVQADLTFIESVVTPFGHAVQEDLAEASIEKYPKLFRPHEPVGEVESKFEKQFVEAWRAEHGYSLDEIRQVCDEIEDLGLSRNEAVFSVLRSELLERVSDIPNGPHIVSSLLTVPRSSWRIVASGFEKDRQPWRFRRRLSLLRLPIVQINEDADPELIVVPGLVRESMAYTASSFHEGSLHWTQLRSSEMRKWFGTASDQRGREFTQSVARRLQELGWRCETEVAVKKILRKRTSIDFGDVDVFAVNPCTGRVLLIECKDLHFHRTIGELAEQLSDYRGSTHNGKRDSLKKHIDRSVALRSDAPLVAAYAKVQSGAQIESWVVFRNPVPMLFASFGSPAIDGVTTYSKLESL